MVARSALCWFGESSSGSWAELARISVSLSTSCLFVRPLPFLCSHLPLWRIYAKPLLRSLRGGRLGPLDCDAQVLFLAVEQPFVRRPEFLRLNSLANETGQAHAVCGEHC